MYVIRRERVLQGQALAFPALVFTSHEGSLMTLPHFPPQEDRAWFLPSSTKDKLSVQFSPHFPYSVESLMTLSLLTSHSDILRNKQDFPSRNKKYTLSLNLNYEV